MPLPREKPALKRARDRAMKALSRYVALLPAPKTDPASVIVQPRVCGARRESFALGSNMLLNYCVLGGDIPCLVIPLDDLDGLVETLAARIWKEQRIGTSLPAWRQAPAAQRQEIRSRVRSVFRSLNPVGR